jgi:tetratricopeptide (TPR) repeat protein
MHNCIPSILILLALSQMIVGCSNNPIDENIQLVYANKVDRNKHSKDTEKIKIEKNNAKSFQRRNFNVRAFPEDSLYDLISAELAGMRGKAGISQKNYSKQAQKTLDPNVIERAAKISFYYDNSILFLEMTTLWIEVEPSWIPAKILHAIALIKNHRHEEAVPLIILAIENHDARPFFALYESLANRERMDELLNFIQKIQAKIIDTSYVDFAKAEIFYGKGLLKKALKLIDKVLEREVEAKYLSLTIELKGRILLKQGKEQEAYNFIDASSIDDQTKRNLKIGFAKKLLEKDGRSGYQIISMLYDQYPNDPKIKFLFASANRIVKSKDVAINLYEQLIEDQKYKDINYLSHWELGSLHLEINPQKALFHLQKYIQGIDTGYIDINSKKGTARIYMSMHMLKKLLISQGKINEFRSIMLELRPKVPALSRGLYNIEINMLVRKNYLDESYELLSLAIAEFPDDTNFLYKRSIVGNRQEKILESEQDLKAILIINPYDPIALNALGYSMITNGNNFDEALGLITKSLEISPEVPETLDSLGWVYYKLGEYEDAIKYLKKAISRLSKPIPEISAHLGEVLWVINKKEEAMSVWNEALKEYPNNSIIMKTMEQFKIE